MLSLQEVRDRLVALGRPQWHRVAKESSVPFSTLKKIAYGQTPTPRSDTLEKISSCLEAEPKRRNGHKRAA